MKILKSLISRNNLQNVFYFLSALLVLLVSLELVKTRIITVYLDINRVLLVWLASAIILLFWSEKKDRSNF